ncbi:sensor histidine kinase [Fulvivirga lutea]|uniref:histidine kinase n=1 Tax=Fulvivirga lutea TaxID=2810512 RepID=A0A975A004_9BACT|nr:HAMP domain-containing sensor histidine kinase [Fulvivirga lutea]QSE96864.1 hypothetical protein JR347_14865 [Fulvivirga lutea]
MSQSEHIKEGILANNERINKLLSLVSKTTDAPLMSELTSELKELLKNNMVVGKEALAEIKKQESQLKKIEQLTKENETIASENYLLQYKKKDLLVLANNLEDAYDEIAEKNKEITKKAQEVIEANEEMQRQKDEIEEKTRELESQKEALEDQADYLHEANERITQMHTELQNQKNEILEKNEELINLNNEKNNLIGIVAHDLKSPLNQIEGLVSLIKLTSQLEGETLQFVETISTSVGRLNAMITKILDTEAIESKKLNLKMEEVDLVKILERLIKNFKHTAESKQLKIVNEIKVKKAVTTLDESYCNQIFENLISNAIKFSPTNRSIFIRLTKEKEGFLAEVKDEGQGLTKSDLKKLFGKYQKLSAQPTGNETSTGLGLSIVKKYVEGMKGEIWCESEHGQGASFFVKFPIK